MQKTIKIYVHANSDDLESFKVTTVEGMDVFWGPALSVQDITISYDPQESTAYLIKHLEQEKQEIQTNSLIEITKLQERIQKLQALPQAAQVAE
jgi:hypothetical protein